MTTAETRREALRRFMELRGLNANAWARAAGISEGTIRNYLAGRVSSLNALTSEKLAASERVEPNQMFDPNFQPQEPTDRPPANRVGAGQSAPRSNVAPEIIPGDQLVGARDFPVYASAEGGRGQMLVIYDPIEYVKRPAPLAGVPGGFGMYMVGDSMEPVYRPGDMLLCHPSRPAASGDDVLVVIRGENGDLEGMVKRSVRTAGERIILKQYNPQEEFEVERSTIQGIYQIVGSYRRR